MKSIRIVFLVFVFCSFCKETTVDISEGGVSPKEPKQSTVVKIHVQWEYTNLPLKMSIHELAGGQPLALWTTGSVALEKKKPFGKEIEGGVFELAPGRKKAFMLVMENLSDKDLYFFAAPHSALPVEHSFGFKFKCLCVNHAFTVPKAQVWYRVVEIRLSPDYLGDSLFLKHNLIGMSKERVLEFEKSAKSNIHSDHD